MLDDEYEETLRFSPEPSTEGPSFVQGSEGKRGNFLFDGGEDEEIDAVDAPIEEEDLEAAEAEDELLEEEFEKDEVNKTKPDIKPTASVAKRGRFANKVSKGFEGRGASRSQRGSRYPRGGVTKKGIFNRLGPGEAVRMPIRGRRQPNGHTVWDRMGGGPDLRCDLAHRKSFAEGFPQDIGQPPWSDPVEQEYQRYINQDRRGPRPLFDNGLIWSEENSRRFDGGRSSEEDIYRNWHRDLPYEGFHEPGPWNNQPSDGPWGRNERFSMEVGHGPHRRQFDSPRGPQDMRYDVGPLDGLLQRQDIDPFDRPQVPRDLFDGPVPENIPSFDRLGPRPLMESSPYDIGHDRRPPFDDNPGSGPTHFNDRRFFDGPPGRTHYDDLRVFDGPPRGHQFEDCRPFDGPPGPHVPHFDDCRAFDGPPGGRHFDDRRPFDGPPDFVDLRFNSRSFDKPPGAMDLVVDDRRPSDIHPSAFESRGSNQISDRLGSREINTRKDDARTPKFRGPSGPERRQVDGPQNFSDVSPRKEQLSVDSQRFFGLSTNEVAGPENQSGPRFNDDNKRKDSPLPVVEKAAPPVQVPGAHPNPEFQVAVVHKYSSKKFDADEAAQIRSMLLADIMKVAEAGLQDGTQPQLKFLKSGLNEDGIYSVSAEDEITFKWLLQWRPSPLKCEKTNKVYILRVIRMKSFKFPHKIGILIDKNIGLDNLVETLSQRYQNSHVPFSDWRVLSQTFQADNRYLIFAVDDYSINMLQRMRCTLQYENTKIVVHLLK